MRGTNKDFHCNEKVCEFKRYNKDGTISSIETYKYK